MSEPKTLDAFVRLAMKHAPDEFAFYEAVKAWLDEDRDTAMFEANIPIEEAL